MFLSVVFLQLIFIQHQRDLCAKSFFTRRCFRVYSQLNLMSLNIPSTLMERWSRSRMLSSLVRKCFASSWSYFMTTSILILRSTPWFLRVLLSASWRYAYLIWRKHWLVLRSSYGVTIHVFEALIITPSIGMTS